MNVLSLFSGIGGLDLGLERAGMTVVGQVEIDPWCRSILAKHWPEVPRHDDVRTTAGWWGGRAVDLVCGGFPCQPVSLAGKRQAQADSRWLWPAFADVIRQLRPSYALMENVPGLLGRGFGDVLGDLASIGYDAEWDCVPAAFVGAPHIRNRVWIVAYPQRESVRAVAGSVPAAPGTGESEGPERQRLRPDARHGGTTLADSESGRRESIWLAKPAGQQGARGRQPHGCGENWHVNDAAAVADASSSSGLIWPGRRQQQSQGSRSSRRSDWWATEPDVGRVAHGIPRRVDRLRGLGNAVVPAVAEHVGRLILDAESAHANATSQA